MNVSKQFYYARLSTTCTDIRQVYLEFDINVCVHVCVHAFVIVVRLRQQLQILIDIN